MQEKPKVLSARDITLQYKSKSGFLKCFVSTALENVSFDVYRGENIGVIGGNGCGKTSLLRVIAKIIDPSEGELHYEKGVRCAMLTLGLGFRPDLSGRDNSVLSAMLQGKKRKEAIYNANSIKQFSELGKYFEQPVKTYSAGMRARLGFSTAVSIDLDLMLLDEIMSVGDQGFRQKAEGVLSEKMRGDQSTIIVSHNLTLIENMCERCIWLENGMIKSIGDVRDVVSEYRQHKKNEAKEESLQ